MASVRRLLAQLRRPARLARLAPVALSAALFACTTAAPAAPATAGPHVVPATPAPAADLRVVGCVASPQPVLRTFSTYAATGDDTDQARERAREAAGEVRVVSR